MKLFRWTILVCVIVLSVSAVEKPADVGLYVGCGSRGNGVIQWARLLTYAPQINLTLLDGADITSGGLKKIDLLVMPGGSGFDQYDSMDQEAGAAAVRNYVREGGAYFGTCAGIAFALNEEKRARLIPFARTPGPLRGGMTTTVTLTRRAADLLGVQTGDWPIRYHNGPLPCATEDIAGCTAEVISTYNCELMQKGEMPFPMHGKPAAVWAVCGRGKLLAFSCHPEMFPVSHPLIKGGLRALTGHEVSFNYPHKNARPLRIAFYTGALGGKIPVETALMLDARADIDLLPTTNSEITEGRLNHADILFLPEGDPSLAKRIRKNRTGFFVDDFAERGGQIIRSIKDIPVSLKLP
ncbi:MAG: BPL-N domain-containing protein [Kiritimatiellia bacterium]